MLAVPFVYISGLVDSFANSSSFINVSPYSSDHFIECGRTRQSYVACEIGPKSIQLDKTSF